MSAPEISPLPPSPRTGKFVTGSLMRHTLVMTSTGSIGLLAIFITDLIDMYFIGLLGEVEIAAAIGYAGSILFFMTSVGIGLAIGATAVVAHAIGSGKPARARRLAVNAHIFSFGVSALIALLLWFLLPGALALQGAEGRAHALATRYLEIIVPSMPLLALGMCSAGILRAVGDARRAMYVTLFGGITNALLDPFFIFTLDLKLDGAAIASVLSRIVVASVGLYGVIRIHRILTWPRPRRLLRGTRPIAAIAFPAILTNIATPIANAYLTYEIAAFGDGPVAGWAIIGRIIPAVFAGIFALSGAVGPILAQNLGAGAYGRVREGLRDALIFTFGYTLAAWALLFTLRHGIADAFNASGDARQLIGIYCVWLAPTMFFFGSLFVANAAFNNLGRPHYSTLFNWAAPRSERCRWSRSAPRATARRERSRGACSARCSSVSARCSWPGALSTTSSAAALSRACRRRRSAPAVSRSGPSRRRGGESSDAAACSPSPLEGGRMCRLGAVTRLA